MNSEQHYNAALYRAMPVDTQEQLQALASELEDFSVVVKAFKSRVNGTIYRLQRLLEQGR